MILIIFLVIIYFIWTYIANAIANAHSAEDETKTPHEFCENQSESTHCTKAQFRIIVKEIFDNTFDPNYWLRILSPNEDEQYLAR